MKDLIKLLPSKVLPGAFSVLTIILLTKSLDTVEYGRYSYIISSALLLNVLCFSWLYLAVNRFYLKQGNIIDRKVKSTCLITSFSVGFIVFICVLITALIAKVDLNTLIRWLMVVAIAWLNGIFDMLIQHSVLMSQKLKYTISVLIRHIFVLISALTCYFFNVSEIIVFIMIITSYFVSITWLLLSDWLDVRLTKFDFNTIKKVTGYGVPLILNFGLIFVVTSSDKLLIEYYLGVSDVGVYSASYDFFSQIVIGLSSVMSIVFMPSLVKSYNQSIQKFLNQFELNLKIGLVYSLIMFAFLILIFYLTIDYFIGEDYLTFAKESYILIVSMTILYCFYSYCMVLYFQVLKKLRVILMSSLFMAVINVTINLIYLPGYGIEIGLYSTLTSFLFGFIFVSAVLIIDIRKHKVRL
jgi:O-antigen/teichoic acid export membrane protein